MDYTVDQLRLLLRDENSVVFSDDQLELYRSTYPQSIFRAAALAIRSWAIEAAAAGKSVKTDDLAVDLRSRGKDLLEVATSLEEQAEAEESATGADYFNIVAPYPVDRLPGARPPVWPDF